jgi:hypothetical protein
MIGQVVPSSSGAYKSQFLKDKLLQQNEKRKLEKKMPRKTTDKTAEANKENAKGGK